MGREVRFLAGVPELLVLQLVSERPRYGYEIVEAIRRRSEGRLAFGEGVIYPLLHSLEDRGLVASSESSHRGRRRIYYRISRRGARRLERTTQRWTSVRDGVTALLGGAPEPAEAEP